MRRRLASAIFASHSQLVHWVPELIMVLRSIGPALIAILMRGDRAEGPGSDWLLHGPSDPGVVESRDPAEGEIVLLAAE